MLGVPDRPGAAMTIFSQIAARNIAMDMIVQNVGDDGQADISFTVFRDDLPATLDGRRRGRRANWAPRRSATTTTCRRSRSSAWAWPTQTGVADRMFRALAEAGINIQMITTSEIKISVLVAREHGHRGPADACTTRSTWTSRRRAAGAAAAAAGARRRPTARTPMIARLQGMEDLIIDDITLDETQARVTIVGMPDTPGLAAQVFDEIAAGGHRRRHDRAERRPRGARQPQLHVPQGGPRREPWRSPATLAKQLGCPPPTSCPQVAKLSVSGIGMRSHTDVASRMFQSLAAAGINVDMISTSEVRVNVVVDGKHGRKGLDALREGIRRRDRVRRCRQCG